MSQHREKSCYRSIMPVFFSRASHPWTCSARKADENPSQTQRQTVQSNTHEGKLKEKLLPPPHLNGCIAPTAVICSAYFCWSFMVSMMVLSSLTCVLSSSRAVWPWLKCSVFGFPSVPNRDGEFDLWPVVPIAIEWNPGDGEGDSDGCTLLPLATPPGFGGKEVLLSDTCNKKSNI